MKTVVSGFVLTNFVSTIVIILLHFENRSRYNGTALWILNYIFQTAAIFLIALRGTIHDWISIDLSNSLSLGGTLLGYIGLCRFTGVKLNHVPNYILVIIFTLVHITLTFIHPDLSLRNLNVAIAGGILFIQAFWLLLFRVSDETRKITWLPGFTYLIFIIICFVRIFKFFLVKEQSQDFFHEDHIESIILIAYQMNILFLTYSIVLMYNKKALNDIIFGEEKYSKAFNTSPYGIMLTRFSDGKIVETNPGFLEITGYTRSDIAENSSIDLLWQTQSQRDEVLNQLKQSGQVKEYETIMRKKDGAFWSLYSATLLKVQGVQHILSSINDITRKKEAEENLKILNAELEVRVAERTAQLVESNKELEAFSYSVSHDLRAPLRAIHGFTKVFSEEYGNQMDNEGKRICSIIESSTVRMGHLIDDLLALSRIGRKELLQEVIEMKSLADEVLREMLSSQPLPDHDFSVKYMPPVLGDPGTIRIVFSNLISNAIKYSSKTRKPRIEIGSFRRDQTTVYYVRDNGIGFSMQYYDKLFKVFQRLHSPREYDGNGIGLAIVERIIRRHNGQIWAEGEQNKGAVFCFTLNQENDSNNEDVISA
jgi:PAS domain S-box-containing protein